MKRGSGRSRQWKSAWVALLVGLTPMIALGCGGAESRRVATAQDEQSSEGWRADERRARSWCEAKPPSSLSDHKWFCEPSSWRSDEPKARKQARLAAYDRAAAWRNKAWVESSTTYKSTYVEENGKKVKDDRDLRTDRKVEAKADIECPEEESRVVQDSRGRYKAFVRLLVPKTGCPERPTGK